MRKHFIYLSLIPISFFMFICNAKADLSLTNKDFTNWSGSDINQYYYGADLNVVSKDSNQCEDPCNNPNVTSVYSYNIAGKSCYEISNVDNYQCYLEKTKNYDYYVSKGPKEKTEIIEKNGYFFIIDIAYINRNNEKSYYDDINIPYEKIEGKVNTNEYTIENIYHLGWSNGWILSDQNNENPDRLKIDDFIEKFGEWSTKATFYPLSAAKINGDSVEISDVSDYYRNSGLQGINVKAFVDTGKGKSWSTKFYIPIVYKVKLSVKYCTIEKAKNEDGEYNIYYGKLNSDGTEHILNDDDGLNNELDKIKSRYEEECNNKTIDVPSSKTCGINVTNDECSGQVQIKDDASCIFDTSNINTSVTDNSNNPNKFTTFYNEYCNISCAEEINIKLPEKVGPTKAGTYYTWNFNDNLITAKGTRTCRATVDMSKLKKGVTNSLSDDKSVSAKDVISNILTISGETVNYTHNDQYSYNQENEALKELYDSIDDTYSYSSSQSCNCSLYSCDTRYSFEFSTDLLGDMKFINNGRCGNTSIIKSESLTLSGGTITLEKFKKSIQNHIATTAKKITKELNKVNNCSDAFNTTKNSTYDFDPEIEFSYPEPYSELFKGEKYKKTNISDENVTNVSFKKTKLNYYDGSSETSKDYYYVEESGYIESTATKVNKYVSPLKFYSLAPTGEAVIKQGSTFVNYNKQQVSTNSKFTNELSTDDYDVYPIALTSTTKNADNLDKYSFTITKLGDYDITSARSNIGRMDSLIEDKNKNVYYCTYEISKDITACENDKDCKANFYYRNISLNNVNPNKRELGKNWTNEKAKATLCEIAGGKYNNGDCTSQANTSPESTYEKPEYSFTLTPENMQEIKKYNLEKEKDSNGYANFDMTKIDASTKDQNGNALSEGVWYKSNFIWDTNTCQNCFTNKTNEKETTFSKWSDSAKLSGTGPAWK